MSGGGIGNALTMVAPRGADHLSGQRAGLHEVFKIRQTTPDFECPDRGVVLVLDPAVGAQALAECGPTVLGCGPKSRIYRGGCSFDLCACGQLGHFAEQWNAVQSVTVP